MLDSDEIKRRFEYHPPSGVGQRNFHTSIRQEVWRVADAWNEILPEGREKSTAITKLEEAMFWANAAYARDVSDR